MIWHNSPYSSDLYKGDFEDKYCYLRIITIPGNLFFRILDNVSKNLDFLTYRERAYPDF